MTFFLFALDLDPSTQYEVDVHAFTKFGAGEVSVPHYLTTNIGNPLDNVEGTILFSRLPILLSGAMRPQFSFYIEVARLLLVIFFDVVNAHFFPFLTQFFPHHLFCNRDE